MQADVAIVGGGPAGLSAAHAILVARPHTKVVVFERSDVRPRGAVVSLPPNGVRALSAISPALKQALAAHSTDHLKLRSFSPAGELLASSDKGEHNARIREHGEIFSLPWHVLQRTLAEALPPGVLHLQHSFLRYHDAPQGGKLVAEFQAPDGVRQVEASLLLGCDGGQSRVRQQMLGDGPPNFMGVAIWWAVCPRPADWVLDSGRVGWGERGKPSIIVSTLQDGSLCWQGFAPWPADQLETIGGGRRAYVQEGDGGSAGRAWQQGEQRLSRVLAAFAGYPKAVTDLLASTDPAAVTEHGQFYREAADCQTYALGRVALTGDAAHLGTPSLGQGCSQVLEDALELGRAVGEHGCTPLALADLQAVRLPLAGAVQAASVELFKGFASGKGSGKHEYDVNIEQGFIQRTFQPLVAGRAAAT